jgi:hypothetical protein
VGRSLFLAGSAGSVPAPRRGLPALLLRAGGDCVLLALATMQRSGRTSHASTVAAPSEASWC